MGRPLLQEDAGEPRDPLVGVCTSARARLPFCFRLRKSSSIPTSCTYIFVDRLNDSYFLERCTGRTLESG